MKTPLPPIWNLSNVRQIQKEYNDYQKPMPYICFRSETFEFLWRCISDEIRFRARAFRDSPECPTATDARPGSSFLFYNETRLERFTIRRQFLKFELARLEAADAHFRLHWTVENVQALLDRLNHRLGDLESGLDVLDGVPCELSAIKTVAADFVEVFPEYQLSNASDSLFVVDDRFCLWEDFLTHEIERLKNLRMKGN